MLYGTRNSTRSAKVIDARFHGRRTLQSRTVPLYPVTAEREFVRLAGRWMGLAGAVLKEGEPELRAVCRQNRQDARFDAAARADLHGVIMEMAQKLERLLVLFGLEKQVWKIARIARNTSLREWMRCVRATFGVDLETGYYNDQFYGEILDLWCSESVQRLRSSSALAFSQVSRSVEEGLRRGDGTGRILSAAWQIFKTERNRARAMARNQVGTLNSRLAKKHQTDAGCRSYRWATAKDDRVRSSHRLLDGEIFSWEDAPEMSCITKKGVKMTGRRCHPGEDYNCRCVAVPVFERDSVRLQVRGEEEQRASGGVFRQWNAAGAGGNFGAFRKGRSGHG